MIVVLHLTGAMATTCTTPGNIGNPYIISEMIILVTEGQ
jgi:hypothetical protein